MVQISEPRGPAPVPPPVETNPIANQPLAVGSSGVDSGAITEDAIESELTDSAPTDAPSGFTADATVPNEAEPPAAMGPMPPNWQSERTQRSRQIGLVVALGGAGLLGAIGLFGWFVKNWNDQPSAAVVESTDTTDPSISEDTATVSPDPTEATQPPITTDQVADGSSTENPVVDPEASDDRMPEANVPPEVAKQTDVPSDLMPTDVIPDDLLPSDPLGPIDSEDPIAATDDVSPDAIAELPDEAQSLIDVFNLGGGKQVLPEIDAPATIDDIEIEGPSTETIDPMMIANPPEPINLKRALAIEIAIATSNDKGYPLADLMLLLSQVSGVPIQVDWVSFDLVGTSISDPVKVKRGTRPLGDCLRQVAESVNAVIIDKKTMLVLQPSEDALNTRLEQLLDVSDFGATEASAVQLLNAFLAVGNGKKLQVGEEIKDKQLAALAVDSLRRMRSVPPKIDDALFDRWGQVSTAPRLDWPKVGDGDPGPQFPSPVAVAGLLRRLSQRNQATCFVNWIDASRRKMSPEQLVMPYMGASDQPGGKPKVGVVLENVLDPFQLHVRQVDTKHWWVGTQASYDLFPVLVWTPPLGNQQAGFTTRINQAMAAQPNFPFRMSVDPITGRALLLIPRFIVRQLPKIQAGLKLAKAN